MTSEPTPTVAGYIRGLARRVGPGGHGLSDAELLDRFVASQDEAAFEVLVWRHGGMVLGVCRRLLPHESDVEDAFQAAFMTLVRKASTIGRKGALVGWLYRVAYRAALAARKRASRHEPLTEAVLESLTAQPEDATWGELKPVLDDEVSRLPERLRVAFVLCCLEGRTVDEAAAELGCPRGTVGSWVSRAREKLRDRLTRRGVALPAAALVGALARTAEAAPPAAVLARDTAHAAALAAAGKPLPAGLLSAAVPDITRGALNAMFVTKLKLVTAAFVSVAVLATATGAPIRYASAASPDAAAVPADAPKSGADKPADPTSAPKTDKVPEDAYGLSGSVVGKFVSKDPEKGSLVLEIRQVKNVWKGSKATKPKSVEGKTIKIDGVFGKFIDALVTLKEGDGVQIEVKHVKGDNLNFLGEELKKVELPAAGKDK